MGDDGPGAKPRLTKGVVALVVLASAGAGVVGALAIHSAATGPAHPGAARRGLRGDAVWARNRKPAPAFTLRDQHSRLVSLSEQRGRPVVLAFMDSRCKVICKLEGPMLGSIIARAGRGASLVVVSVNPWQDTPASTRAAAAHWRLGSGWLWLRGSPARLRPIWNTYGIKVKRTQGDVSHSTAIYLIDRSGHERAGFNFPFAADDVLHDLRLLSAGDGPA